MFKVAGQIEDHEDRKRVPKGAGRYDQRIWT